MAQNGDEVRTVTVSQVASVSKFNILLISSPGIIEKMFKNNQNAKNACEYFYPAVI